MTPTLDEQIAWQENITAIFGESSHARKMYSAILATLREAKAREQAVTLPCGHHPSLAVNSAETGRLLYCDLCDTRKRRNDAEARELELTQQRQQAKADAEDAARLRWGVKHSAWLRHEHTAYVAIPVALSSDLSCYATRIAAIDAARERGNG